MENLGIKVVARLVVHGVSKRQVFRNVTEVHYNYRREIGIDGLMVAFESDIHGTGATYDLEANSSLWLEEFHTEPETEKAEGF
jgi:hypothetical protein